MGMDSRKVTPKLASVVVHLAAEIRSFARTEQTTDTVLTAKVSESTIRRLAKEVGLELADLEETDELNADKESVAPEIAVVSCDGGRIRTRVPDNGRGVELSGENGWKEDKVASFERMDSNAEHMEGIDPCPELPTSFRTVEKVAKITEKRVLEVELPNDPADERVVYEGPKRILRTTIGSMANSKEFGVKMRREARRRQLHRARRRAFLADGLNWNWTIWEEHFSSFVPILDFIHAIEYVFTASEALHTNDQDVWTSYAKYITLCWQGRVAVVIDELTKACVALGIDLDVGVEDDDPHKPITDAIRYLTNNQSKMNYPSYRRQGLPVTSSPMESLVKQINLRVKGTEMFWDDPDGAEAILQIRAAALSDDGRLEDYLNKRPGHPFVRRTTPAATVA
jgi:hypothetical protein